MNRYLILFVVLVGIGVLGAGLWMSTAKKADEPSQNALEQARSPREFQKLIGRWMRPDGGYVIEIRKVNASGEMDAGYFNPRPINVSRALATQDGQRTLIFIELNDVGYPGATYNLVYHPQKDILLGLYYQPSAGQNFEVVFMRNP